MATTTNSLLQTTLGYAERGWPVFPCHSPANERCSCGKADCSSPAKHPRTAHGLDDATTDPETIRAWWERWADANVAVRTGKVSGIVVIDIDASRGGLEAWSELQDMNGRVDALTSITGGGGKHLIFLAPDQGLKNTSDHIAPGVDTRAEGGYIIAPPSVHISGQPYSWEDASRDPGPMPDWLLAMWPKRTPADSNGHRHVGATIPIGQRNAALTSLAGSMRRRGVGEAAIAAALVQHNAERSETPLPEREVRSIAHSVSQYEPAASEELFHLTDLGNAKRLVALHGKDVRYCFPRKTWLVWDGIRWAFDDSGEVYRRAKATVATIYAKAAEEPDADRRRALAKWAATSESDTRISAMISLARSEPSIPATLRELDTDPWLFNVLNGTIELRTGRLREHRRSDMITMCAPVVFDPNARDRIWEDFLDRVLPNSELQGFVQRAAGYSSTGNCGEEVLFFPYGPTQTGKSTLVFAVAKTFGDYAMTADFGAFLARDRNAGGPRNDIAAMSGKRMVISVEVDPGQRMAGALVKQLTGGDDVRARFLFQESFQVDATFKIWLAANDRPHVRDDDDAIWRRILQIPFDEQISDAERDPAVKAHLCDPKRGGAAILAWAVQGCLNWQLLGLRVPDAVRGTTAAYRSDMDPLADFISECCIVQSEVTAGNTAIWKAYEQWAHDNGIRRPLGRKGFTQRLQDRGFEVFNSGGRSWQGIGLLAQEGVNS